MEEKYATWIATYLARVGYPRGQCVAACAEMCVVFPELVEVRGWFRGMEHCWLLTNEGTIVDPTVLQFDGQISLEHYRAWKACVKCGAKDRSRSRNPGGDCRACRRAYVNKKRAENHDLFLAKERAYAEKRKKDESVVFKKKSYARDWYQANREKRLAQEAKRRADPIQTERQRERDAKRYADPVHRQKHSEYIKLWRVENKDTIRARARKRMFGISEEEQEAKLKSQDGKCAACGDDLKPHRETHLDHDHSNDMIRDFICRRCNVAIGLMFDSPVRARRIAEYLERWGRT
jgi:hypothetical protein